VYIECSVMVGGGGQLKLHDPVNGHLLLQLLLAGGGRSLATCSPITVRADTLQNEHIFTQRPNCLGQKGVINYRLSGVLFFYARLMSIATRVIFPIKP
jgi:hypothetical protein